MRLFTVTLLIQKLMYASTEDVDSSAYISPMCVLLQKYLPTFAFETVLEPEESTLRPYLHYPDG